MNSPESYGFPSKFSTWRDTQVIAIQSAISSPKRFLIQSLPTGSGKSLMYMGISKLGKFKRTLILTSTKALQDQLIGDFSDMGLKEIRGKVNYSCLEVPAINCDIGPCHSGFDCVHKDNGCLYFDAQRRARNSSMVVTNYSYWMSLNKYGQNGEGIGEFDLIVLDEAHEAPSILQNFLTVKISKQLMLDVLDESIPDYKEDTKRWSAWARFTNSKLKMELTDRNNVVKEGKKMPAAFYTELAKITNLQKQVEQVESCDNSWCCFHEDKHVTFGVKHGFRGYAESYLWPMAKKVVLVSGTVREKTAKILGMKEEEYQFEDYPSTFDVTRCPNVWVKTLKCNKDTSQYDFVKFMVARIDQIIGSRSDRKGIIHTVSYDRANLIKANSLYSHMMITHSRTDSDKHINSFLRSKEPKVLVSPIVSTGRDFPMDKCEYQIMVKLPFPSLGDRLLMERAKLDKSLVSYLTMQSLVQSCGRGMRSEQDQCENFILDDSIEWWLKFSKDLLPYWWLESFSTNVIVPSPLIKLP